VKAGFPATRETVKVSLRFFQSVARPPPHGRSPTVWPEQIHTSLGVFLFHGTDHAAMVDRPASAVPNADNGAEGAVKLTRVMELCRFPRNNGRCYFFFFFLLAARHPSVTSRRENAAYPSCCMLSVGNKAKRLPNWTSLNASGWRVESTTQTVQDARRCAWPRTSMRCNVLRKLSVLFPTIECDLFETRFLKTLRENEARIPTVVTCRAKPKERFRRVGITSTRFPQVARFFHTHFGNYGFVRYRITVDHGICPGLQARSRQNIIARYGPIGDQPPFPFRWSEHATRKNQIKDSPTNQKYPPPR